MGISTVSGLGQDARMVVVGTACLDHNGMRCCQEVRVQTRAPCIASDALSQIVKVSGFA
jgi:hypothetical protein